VVESTARSFLEFMDHEGWQDMERQFDEAWGLSFIFE